MLVSISPTQEVLKSHLCFEQPNDAGDSRSLGTSEVLVSALLSAPSVDLNWTWGTSLMFRY